MISRTLKSIALAAMCLLVPCILFGASPSTYRLTSPSGSIKAIVVVDGSGVSYSLYDGGQQLLSGCPIALETTAGVFPERGAKPRKFRMMPHSGVLQPAVPLKFSTIEDNYNLYTMEWKGGITLEWRLYDDALCYRFVTNLPGDVDVTGEKWNINLTEGTLPLHVQRTETFTSNYEEFYEHPSLADLEKKDAMIHLPILADAPSGKRILVGETNLRDYPGAFFKTKGGVLESLFPPCPLTWEEETSLSVRFTSVASYIARTTGKRTYPWRYYFVSRSDEDLLACTISPRLGIENFSQKGWDWVQPGQSTWEWWNGGIPYGNDVDFTSGMNTATYKYFVDFAEHYGVPFILIDGGWTRNTLDPFHSREGLDIPEVISYAKSKGVGVFLWLSWLCVEQHFDLFEEYEKWGVTGVKIDFMDRSDQWMVNFYEKMAAEAARCHLLVDFHGAYKPSGLEYQYPNVLSYEGVRGMEQMGGCKPDNSLYLPFMRNICGSMEYTPGAMISTQPRAYDAKRPNAGSIGTRAYQMALYVVFESAFTMLSDNPTLYYQNDDCTRFITKVPVVWDETVPLVAKAGDYLVEAKRKGDEWFIGAIRAEGDEWMNCSVSLDFLEPGAQYSMEAFSDGSNAPTQALHYYRTTSTVKKGDKLDLKLSVNGGFAARLVKL